MINAIQVNNLKKSYGNHIVLNNVDFCVQKGEIFALLGVNGAGKTTTLECIEGLRKYDSGSIKITGKIGINYSRLPSQDISKQWKLSDCLLNGITA